MCMEILCGIIVSKLRYQTIGCEFDSHWAIYTSDLEPHLSLMHNNLDIYFKNIFLFDNDHLMDNLQSLHL